MSKSRRKTVLLYSSSDQRLSDGELASYCETRSDTDPGPSSKGFLQVYGSAHVKYGHIVNSTI